MTHVYINSKTTTTSRLVSHLEKKKHFAFGRAIENDYAITREWKLSQHASNLS